MRQLNRLTCILLVLALLVPMSALAAPEDAAKPEGKITAPSLNMRRFPSTTADVLTMARQNDLVTIVSSIDQEGQTWYRVCYNNLLGYMSAEYIQAFGSSNMASGTALSSTASAPPATLQVATVKQGPLRLRAKPSTTASVVTSLPKNTQITVVSPETQDSDGHAWLKVNYQGAEGYISAEYVALNDSGSFSAGTGTITGGTVNLRSEPTVESVVLRKLVPGTAVKVTGVENGWYKVTHDDKTGYVHPDYLKIVPPAAPKPAAISTSRSSSASSSSSGTAYGLSKTTSSQDLAIGQSALEKANPTAAERKIVETAFKYLGCKYVYGASNGKTFDCSGFTSWVMKETGHSVARGATSQYTSNGTKVASKSELRPGDLVFFKDSSAGKAIVTHVGIYIGSGYFIHAGSSSNGSGKCVKVNSLTSGHYSPIYKGAKRIV